MFARLCGHIDGVLAQPVTNANALRLRDLLMVALTTTTALRLRNVVALTLGESMLRHRHGYEIRFPAHAVKNARAIAMQVMPELTAPLDRYIEAYRPLLFGRHPRDNPALWIIEEDGRESRLSFAEMSARSNRSCAAMPRPLGVACNIVSNSRCTVACERPLVIV